MKNNRIIQFIISQLLDIQNGKLWMGDSFDNKINSITDVEAFIRPLPNLHSVAELIAHLTEWKKDIILTIKEGRGQLTTESEFNWRDIEELKKMGWKKLIDDYLQTSNEAIKLLQSKDDSFLNEQYQDQDYKRSHDFSFKVNGLLHHDLYHLGQMGIVIKLIKEGTHQRFYNL